jgi:hypothetical protein
MAAVNNLMHVGLLPFKGRNNLLDRLFYDVDELSEEEKADLSPLKDREGTVLLVYPSDAGRKFVHYRNALQLILSSGHEVEGIAIAGVGSSVLGTAALARNVADAIGGPVAGIVSGYGVTDLMAEALGGWFFFGAIDRAKYRAEAQIAELCQGGSAQRLAAGAKGISGNEINAVLDGLPLQADTSALMDLLEAAPPKLRWLVGHSKGCLLIDYVLERYVRGRVGGTSELYDRLEVVTLGAVVNLPRPFRNATQVIGAIDRLGKINSDLKVQHAEVPGARHHLNRSLPAHLDAVETIRRIVRGKAVTAEAALQAAS